MPVENKVERIPLVKTLKKFILMGLGAATLLWGGNKEKDQVSDSPGTSSIVQTAEAHKIKMDVAQKIDYMVEYLQETNGPPGYRGADWRSHEVTSQEKKDRIRQNLKTYATIPLGRKLLSKLDVTKVVLRDTLKSSSGPQGQRTGIFKSFIETDFENPNELSTIHHELTHALQHQQASVTAKEKLNEIDAFLNQAKFLKQAASMGILTENADDSALLYNYQKYNGNDVEYVEKFLYPEILWMSDTYNKMFKDNSPDSATEADFKSYAQLLGADDKSAEIFAKTLTQNSVEKIEYESSSNGGETKITRKGNMDSVNENLIEYFDINGDKIETQKIVYDSQGNYISERFNSNGIKIETIKKSKDANGNHVKIVEKGNDSEKTIQKYVNGILEEKNETISKYDMIRDTNQSKHDLREIFKKHMYPTNLNNNATLNSIENVQSLENETAKPMTRTVTEKKAKDSKQPSPAIAIQMSGSGR